MPCKKLQGIFSYIKIKKILEDNLFECVISKLLHLKVLTNHFYMFKIQIPKPCHEDWNAMTPTQQGSFCGACSKEVVDFTPMTDAEVQRYFLNRTTDKTCGRFKTEQIDRIQIYLPENLFLQRMAGWKKFMAIVMIVFSSMLFGCDTAINQNTSEKLEKIQTNLIDTTNIESSQTLGIAMPGFNDTTFLNINCLIPGNPSVVELPIQTLTGDTVIIPDSVAQPTMGVPILLGKPAIVDVASDTATKKPVPDTSKCKDTGYY